MSGVSPGNTTAIRAFELSAVNQVPAAQIAEDLDMAVGDVYLAKSRVAKRLREIVARLEHVYDEL